MNIDYKEIKENARHSLEGNWKVAILSTLVYTFISILTDLMPASTDTWNIILSVISDALFTFGYTVIILHIVRGERADFSEIFTECKRFLKGLGMVLTVGIYTFLWTLLLIVPGVIATIKYSMTFYIWVDNPNISINEAIHKSVEITEGYKWDIFRLGLSFIGWSILVSIPSWGVLFWEIHYNGVSFMKASLLINNYAIHPIVIISLLGMIFVNTYKNVSMAKLYDKLVSK